MSYDLHFLARERDVDPMDTVELLQESEQVEGRTAAVVVRQERLVEILMREAPSLERDTVDYDMAGAAMGISAEVARVRDLYVELFDERGLTVEVADHHATVTVPYWDGPNAEAIWRVVGVVAEVLARETEWGAYDPQLERWIDVRRDATEVRGAFAGGVEHVQRILAEGAPTDSSPKVTSTRFSIRRLFRRT